MKFGLERVFMEENFGKNAVQARISFCLGCQIAETNSKTAFKAKNIFLLSKLYLELIIGSFASNTLLKWRALAHLKHDLLKFGVNLWGIFLFFNKNFSAFEASLG